MELNFFYICLQLCYLLILNWFASGTSCLLLSKQFYGFNEEIDGFSMPHFYKKTKKQIFDCNIYIKGKKQNPLKHTYLIASLSFYILTCVRRQFFYQIDLCSHCLDLQQILAVPMLIVEHKISLFFKKINTS